MSDASFADPTRREQLLLALRALALHGERLEAHGRHRDAGFGLLSRSLARDAAEIRDRYEEGRIAESRFLLHEMTENCVACHSRLPDDRAHPLGQRLVRDETLAAAPPEERVRLEMATRQWDRALATYEALFESRSRSPADLDLMGHFDAYLEACLRVKRDPTRPLATFGKLARREDTPPLLREHMDAWIFSLRELEAREPLGDPLAEAQSLLDDARDRSRFGDDRRALVYYVAASSELHRYVNEPGRTPAELGEAYYLLGLIESRVGRSFWLSQTEHYLEASIRIAPAQRSAQRAYDLLEEFVVSGYTGSGGGSVPEDVRHQLEELKELIEASART
jgi:hypothetical protein